MFKLGYKMIHKLGHKLAEIKNLYPPNTLK